MAWTYILKCADGSYYVGSTTFLEARLGQHQVGEGARYTRRRLPATLVFAHETDSAAEAFFLEKRIQGWSRAKREALINGDLDALRRLASRAKTPPQPTGPEPPPLADHTDPGHPPLVEHTDPEPPPVVEEPER